MVVEEVCPLKPKYLLHRYFKCGTYKRRGTVGNSHGPKLYRKRKKDGNGHRRRSYFGAVAR